MKLLIATHNKKKKAELQRILSPLGINVVTAEDIGCELRDVEETGTTFEENAELKAVAGCEDSGIACIADDSGLCVDYLDGEPGIYSARYSGGHGNDEANIDKLLEKLDGVPNEKRTARFICVACCVFPDGRKIAVKGECEGEILTERHGNGGFGYDPIFKSGDKLFGEITSEEKDKISHRGRALALMAKELKKEITE